MYKPSAFVLAAAMLAACGGGGGSGTSPSTPAQPGSPGAQGAQSLGITFVGTQTLGGRAVRVILAATCCG